FNGDGKPDLAVTNHNSNNVSVLLNTTAPGATSPSFAAQQGFATGASPVPVAVGDFNGDGRPDVIVGNYHDTTVSLLLNTTAPGASTPSFSAQQTFTSGLGPLGIAVKDFNGDGVPDLAASVRGTGSVSILLNTAVPIALSGSPATGTIQDDDAPASVTIAAG